MKIISFDIESNSLHGQAFAVGGVVYTDGHLIETFQARCPIEGEPDPWVREHIFPVIEDIPETHATPKEMRDAFWIWLSCHKTDGIVVVDFGYPVEARFLMQCQDDCHSRYWQAPYPLHDLGSILLTAGIDPDADRVELYGVNGGVFRHNPLDDALMTAAISYRILQGAFAK